jgi:hypothetical protein
MILSLLVAAGLGVRVMLQSDYRILVNLRGSTEAFYLAEAGLAWSKSEIERTISFPPSPANRTENFTAGRFSVSFLSPTAVAPLMARVGVRSVGTTGNSSSVLQAQLSKVYDLADSAMGLRGNAIRVGMDGESVLVSGIDHDSATAATVPGAKSRPAISVSDALLRGLVEQVLGNRQQQIVESGNGVPAIAQTNYLPASAVNQLATELCGSPQTLISAIPADGALVVESQTWGTPAGPQLRCIEGLPGPADGVNFAGNFNGAGVLVVRNADLMVSGAFHWEGLVIVTGSNVSFMTTGPSAKTIFGAAIVNETGTPASGAAIVDLQGNFRLLFSRLALAPCAALIPPAILNQTYVALPAAIVQDYWRTVSP